MSLRSRLIRLAHADPALRPHLLPILREAAVALIPASTFLATPSTKGVFDYTLEQLHAAWEQVGKEMYAIQDPWSPEGRTEKLRLKGSHELYGKAHDQLRVKVEQAVVRHLGKYTGGQVELRQRRVTLPDGTTLWAAVYRNDDGTYRIEVSGPAAKALLAELEHAGYSVR